MVCWVGVPTLFCYWGCWYLSFTFSTSPKFFTGTSTEKVDKSTQGPTEDSFEEETSEADTSLELDIQEEPLDVYTDREEILAEAEEEDTSSWTVKDTTSSQDTPEIPLETEISVPETQEDEALSFSVVQEESQDELADKVENYDPTLDLPRYKHPTVDLLDEHSSEKVQVTKEELEQKKDRIIETLINFKIGISSIKATIGPTVTLYEIVPEAGVKISKIKNLERRYSPKSGGSWDKNNRTNTWKRDHWYRSS